MHVRPSVCAARGQATTPAAACMQVMSKRGVDIAYVGGGSSVIAAGGYNMEGGNIALWDTVAPLCGGPIASLDHHPSLVTALQVDTSAKGRHPQGVSDYIPHTTMSEGLRLMRECLAFTDSHEPSMSCKYCLATLVSPN